MKFTKIALAVAAVAAAAPALAAPDVSRIAVSSGASAPRGNLVTALGNLCTTGGGTLSPFTTGTGNSNITTYACSTVSGLTTGPSGTYAMTPDANYRNFAGTNFAVLKLNVAGGSFTAVQVLDNPVGHDYFDPAQNTLVGYVDEGTSGTVVGGLMDVELEAFPEAIRVGLTAEVGSAGVGQSFGVAVSAALYGAMFNDQRAASGGATVDKPIPSSCSVTDTNRLECVPTISKGQFATIIDSNENNPAKNLGAQFLAPSLAANTPLRYIRRPDTSGTQASAQNYFLGLPCSTVPVDVIFDPTGFPPLSEPGVTAPPAILPGFELGNLRVLVGESTGNVRDELARSGLYTIGVLSGENNSAAYPWRWLRIQGAAIGENAAPGAGVNNNATVRNGQYDFYYETKFAYLTEAQRLFWVPVVAALGAVTPPVGLVNSTDLTNYNKGGSACRANRNTKES